MIQYSAIMNKKRNEKRNMLLEKIKEVEKQINSDIQNKNLHTQLKLLQKQLSILLVQEIEWKLKYIRQRHFQFANKPGRWLAYKLRKERENKIITCLMDGNQRKYRQKEIKDLFFNFYTNLYKKQKVDESKMKQYLNKQDLMKLDTKHKVCLNERVNLKEIEEVIKKVKKSSTPGPDGFTYNFYTCFKDELLTTLMDLFNNILTLKTAPQSWLESDITLIPKPDQDLTMAKNYRPIALLNVDYKIFAAIMANRLKKVLQELIHEDQTGFLPKRQMRNNLRNVLNILDYLEVTPGKKAALIFLDAEKAFDNLQWKFMEIVMQKLEMGENFLCWIKSIYSSQKAKVIVNGERTNFCKIEKGVRQGCPLSPLLFILVLEVLANNIRNNAEIKGIKVKREMYKLRAFADDLVIMLEDPNENVDILNEKIEEYGNLAGLKINKEKTKVLTKNLNEQECQQFMDQSGYNVVKKLKYLGIWLTNKNLHLVKNNYERLWKEIKSDLDKWSMLKLSLLGRISVIKMNVLPRVLFLFQMIPVLQNVKMLKEWQKDINKFIWQKKKPRVKFKVIKDAKSRGGLGVPDLNLYYDAIRLVWLKEWIVLRDFRLLQLEGHNLKFGWHAYLWSKKVKMDAKFKLNIIRQSLYRVWNKWKEKLYFKIPLWVSPQEALQIKYMNVHTVWLTYDMLLYNENDEMLLKSKEQLQLGGWNLQWFAYLQLKDKYHLDRKDFGFETEKTEFEKSLCTDDDHLIKKMYNFLLTYDTCDEQVKECMIKWAQNFDHCITMDKWEEMWNKKLKFTVSYSLKENFYKMFYRWYMTPNKLAKIYKTENACWKCKDTVGSLYHMWWNCKFAKKFWKAIYKHMCKILGFTFEFKSEVFLLGIYSDPNLEIYDRLLQYMITAARMIYAQKWKTVEIPTIDEWTLKLMDIMEMDKLTYYIQNFNLQKYVNTWKPFMDYLRKQKITEDDTEQIIC